MYNILFNETPVGRAEVKTVGLYYHFSCTCNPPDSGFYRITVTDGDSVNNLGICVPEGSNFTCTARIPKKHLNGDRLSFALKPFNEEVTAIPIQTGEPFSQLDRLDNARLQLTNGQTEIIIDSAQDQPDSGQNP